jgi:hypothetical protein
MISERAPFCFDRGQLRAIEAPGAGATTSNRAWAAIEQINVTGSLLNLAWSTNRRILILVMKRRVYTTHCRNSSAAMNVF